LNRHADLLFLAHRGARRHAPENTLAAFDLALAQGAHGFEFDVRLAVDERLIVCHNARVARRLVAANTFETLAKAAAQQKHALRRRGRPQLCCLEEVLARYASQAFLDIELKVPGTEEKVVALLRKLPAAHGIVVSSFLPRVLQRMHQLAPEIPLGYICRERHKLPQWRRLPVGWVIPHWRLATARAILSLHDARKRVLVWTVNSSAHMRRLTAEGADGIISDDPQLLIRTLGRG